MRQFSRDPEEAKQYYAEIPVQLEIRGTFHEIAMFFDKLSKLPRIVYVRDLELSPVTEGGADVEESDLTGTGILTTFRYLSEEEILLAAEASEGKKGKKGKKRKKK
jgi:type IV pilus assembly protein PilO